MSDLLDKRLLFVTGKGGVGKTTVARAVGLAAARRGKRTIVCELGPEGGHREVERAPGLFGIEIDPERAKREYLEFQLGSRTLAGVLSGSRIFQYLTAAAPGLTELVTIGKIWELAQLDRIMAKTAPYDLVVVDAPATGHGLAMLRSPRTFREIARVGPVRRQAAKIDAFLTGPGTAVVAVALPEEMPVNETLDLEQRLREEMGMAIGRIVVNALYPERFTAADAKQLDSADGQGSPEARAAVAAALSEHRRARAQRAQLRRLKRGATAPVTTLPYLFEPEVEPLSRELERRL